MSSRYIPVSVTNEYLKGAGVVIGAAGSHDDVYLRITFGAMWDDLTKYVTFRDALGENPTMTMLLPNMVVDGTTDTYDVPTPAAAKAHQGRIMVTVSGYTVLNGVQEDTATMTATSFFRVLPADFAILEDGSIDATLAQQLQAEIEAEKANILAAKQAAKDAEAWAVGQVQGVDVDSDAAQYHNNAKYYAEQAGNSATDAADSATEAAGYASDASAAAATIEGESENAEAWAVGKRGGVNVEPGDPTYHNNAKYWAEQAEAGGGGGGGGVAGVRSFNGRTGIVEPEAGDYSKADVGLGNVPNVATNDQTPTYTAASSLTALSSGEKLSVAFGKIAKAISSLISHLSSTSNPHSVTAAQAGADPSGTASSAISTHDASNSAHSSLFAQKANLASGSLSLSIGRDSNGIYIEY